jgi:uncharacterized phosphatase
MKKLCLIRHGQTDWNKDGKLQGREDIELNDTGRSQARMCAEFLKNYSWDCIFSSPLKRAAQTAEIIQRQLTLSSINIEFDFIERDYGLASGLSKSHKPHA